MTRRGLRFKPIGCASLHGLADGSLASRAILYKEPYSDSIPSYLWEDVDIALRLYDDKKNVCACARMHSYNMR